VLAQKYGASYIPLVCGHFTDTETANRYRGRHQRNFFCETCGNYQRRKPKKPPKPPPDESMF
jgi:hypothetical protein